MTEALSLLWTELYGSIRAGAYKHQYVLFLLLLEIKASRGTS